MNRPFAVFDIDGTLIRWQLFHAIVDQLGQENHVPAKSYDRIRAARQQWKQRAHEKSFGKYELELVQVYKESLTNLPVDVFMGVVRQVFEDYKDQVYTYTRDLIRQLQSQNYLLFAISGSQIEIVGLLASYYGFDGYAGSVYERRNNKFTGKEHAVRAEQKIGALQTLIKKHKATTKGSIGIGDSESDVPVLAFVETAIAFNPTKLLFAEAKKREWKVVIERKNMIYELTPHHGTYILASTNGA